MLSPSKHNKVEHNTSISPPTQKEIFSWTLTPDAIALCHIRDVHSLQERTIAGKVPQPFNKHAVSPDFYWIGRVPCRNVRIVGLVLGVSPYGGRTTYIVDDGTGVIECSQRMQPLKCVSEPGKLPPPPEFSPPSASVGDVAQITGTASKMMKFDEWQIKINHIVCSTSRNAELEHYINVSKLHATHYSLSEPFSLPPMTKAEPRVPLTPIRRPARVEPPPGPSNLAAQSNPSTFIASSPAKSESVQATAAKLRHPSRLHHIELTLNTFRIYLKYFMDSGPLVEIDNDDPFTPSFTEELSTLTKHASDATPKASQFNRKTSRLRIHPLDFGKSAAASSVKKTSKMMQGYTVSYLRRVPELVLLANRVVKQEIRLSRKQTKEKEKKTASSSKSGTPPSSANARQPTHKDIKRLIVRAVNELYREGSIVIWDCPAYPCSNAGLKDTSVLWKNMLSNNSSANDTTNNTTAMSSVFSHSKSGLPGLEDEGDLSDPDSSEDVFVSTKPVFLADRLEELIPIVQETERKKQPNNGNPYRGASSEGLLRYLKCDDRCLHIHIDSVEDALKYLEEDGRAWMSAHGQWQLTV